MELIKEKYYDVLKSENIHNNKVGLNYYFESLFEGIDFNGKKVLDIGGGFGLYSFFAAIKGANKVICLEPEDAGSSKGIQFLFNSIKDKLDLDNVSFINQTFQVFNSESKKFDIIISHNSINHLDENACINLLNDKNSQIKYQSIFRKIAELSNPKAKIIICDCSRYNFFQMLKIRNPFSPSIEWHKHQKPEVWINLLKEIGFSTTSLRWKNNDRGIYLKKKFEVNRFKSFLLHSHFCINAIKI